MLARIVLGLLLCLALLPAAAFADQERGWQQMTEQLGLTPEQVTRLKPIMQAFREQQRARHEANKIRMYSVLTQEQADKLATLYGQGIQGQSKGGGRKNLRRALSQLGLSEQQLEQLKGLTREFQTQMRGDHDQYLTQVKAVLSTEQVDRLQQMRQQRKQRQDEEDD